MTDRMPPYIDLNEAYELTRLAYPKGWRLPPTNEIDQQRALEAKEEWQREADEYKAEGE